ncbi:sigma-54-dependent transcriptional regulator [Pseudooceanicola nanhaiensis]|uniref:sigma-54-dependent transcriptional regulator n=1 Tax=Pseudooceanicola nanhaiensis TaxID=375761 RepID=UPI001CD6EE7D|nr:response regulator [Pseudooceanicola nanhaiensis]MCA0919402.1 response regulator [Pseudooceanicola nanhaiensis]
MPDGTRETQAFDPLHEARILIVEDEPGMRNFLVKALTPCCRAVAHVAETAEATPMLERERYDILLLATLLPGRRVQEWLSALQARADAPETILITAYADLDRAEEALRHGAADFVLKPFRTSQLLHTVRRCLTDAQLRREALLLRHEQAMGAAPCEHDLCGTSPAIAALHARLAELARRDGPVLFTGAPGTGQAAAARALHRASPRAGRPFLHLAGLPGAALLAAAQGGTALVEHPSPALMAQLAAAGLRPILCPRDPAALPGEVEAEEVVLPPLNARGKDVLVLAELLMEDLAHHHRCQPLPLNAAARDALLAHDWPGNIPELRNFIDRALILGQLPLEMLTLPGAERLRRVLAETAGDRDEAARRLGLSRAALDQRCADLGV